MVGLTRLLMEHWQIKILALVLALALWLAVAGERKGALVLSVPVKLLNVPADCPRATVDHPTLSLSLAGPKILLLKLRGENIIMPLDMTGIHGDSATFTDLGQRLVLPAGVTVAGVYPPAVTVMLKCTTP